MKLTKYLPLLALAALASACSEDPVLPPVEGPKATYTENTTILDLKQEYWQTSANYVSEIGLTPMGDSIIIKGTVISSDATGNIYKSLMINDGTSALTVAVNAYDLYKTYQYGQEVYINVTGLHIGGYNGLMQLGGEGTYNGQPSMTFMTEDEMTLHAQQNGFGSYEKVQPYIVDTDIPTLTAAKGSAEGLQAWQSQLVRIADVTFEDAGQQFAPGSNTNRYLKDDKGNRINLRCSSYSDFAHDVIPAGKGTVTAILSYYGSDWQLLLIDLGGLTGFDGTSQDPETPDVPEGDGNGSQEAPYTVSQLIALGNPGTSGQWATGYIVGVMNYVEGTGNVFSSTEINANSNIVIAETPTDFGTDYVAVQLPAGDVRSALNLVDNPSNMGKQVSVCGDLTKYCGIVGVKSTSAYVLDGQQGGTQPETPGTGDKYVPATDYSAGGKFIIWADDVIANAMEAGKNYSWMNVTKNVTRASDGSISASASHLYTFTPAEGGFTIQDSNGIYLYMEGTYNSFQLSTELDAANPAYIWTVTGQGDGSVKIVNNAKGKTVQYSSQYSSFGAYETVDLPLPILFQPAK